MIKFFKSVGTEMKATDWPNWRQLRRDSSTVIGTSVFFIIFLGLVDWVVQIFLKLFI